MFLPEWATLALSYWKSITGGSLSAALVAYGTARVMRPRLALRSQINPRDEGAVVIPYYSPAGVLITHAPAYYLRVEVWNRGFKTADGVSVMVDSVFHQGSRTRTRRSPLSWEGERDLSRRFDPITLRRGIANLRGVDLCKVDAHDSTLQLLSKASMDRYDRFEEPGTYEISIIAECSNGGVSARLSVTVEYEGGKYMRLQMIRSHRPWVWS